MLSYPPAAVSGNQRFVVLGCRYAGVAGEPISTGTMATLIGTSYPGMGHYFAEVSNGNVSMTGSTVTTWANLPQNKDYYNPLGTADPNRMYNDCMGAHDAAVNFPDYDGVVMVFNDTILGTGYFQAFSSQGSIPVTIDGQTKAYRLVFVGSPVAGNQFVWAHQVGHTFDLQHSSVQPLASLNSFWDMMAKGGYTEAPYPGRIAVHLKAVDKMVLGWIPSSRVYTATTGTNLTVPLERSAQPAANSDYLIARIPIGANYYTVEARRVAGYDRLGDSALAGQGVLVHRVYPNAASGDVVAEVMDFLLPGELFTDVANRVKVTVVGQGATNYSVQVCLAAGGSGLYGDVNGDGIINVIDAQIVARFSVGLSVPDATRVQTNGDANGDGAINVIDAQVIARYSVGLSTPGAQIGQTVGQAC
jgi:M6 family metalloprotease-like protein